MNQQPKLKLYIRKCLLKQIWSYKCTYSSCKVDKEQILLLFQIRNAKE